MDQNSCKPVTKYSISVGQWISRVDLDEAITAYVGVQLQILVQ